MPSSLVTCKNIDLEHILSIQVHHVLEKRAQPQEALREKTINQLGKGNTAWKYENHTQHSWFWESLRELEMNLSFLTGHTFNLETWKAFLFFKLCDVSSRTDIREYPSAWLPWNGMIDWLVCNKSQAVPSQPVQQAPELPQTSEPQVQRAPENTCGWINRSYYV